MRVWSAMPAVRWTLLWLLGAEALVALVGPLAVPARLYLHLYLGEQSISSTHQFLSGAPDYYLTWDPATGWRNRPGAKRSLWRTDERGARVATVHRPTATTDLLFLGDSVTNGGTGVSNDETISALVENDRVRSINIATMLYGVDQMYLALRDQPAGVRPAVIVVGLTETAIEGLGNRYVPFRRRSEVNMPLLKPRFVLRDGRLTLIPVPPIAAYDDLLGAARTLRELSESDDYYTNFCSYQRCGFLPISALACAAARRAQSVLAALHAEMPYSSLLVAVMHEIVKEGQHRGARTVFILNAAADQTQPASWKKWLPDQYAVLLARLQREGFSVLDARTTLRDSGLALDEMYSADGIHYRVAANKVLAYALSSYLGEGDFGHLPGRGLR